MNQHWEIEAGKIYHCPHFLFNNIAHYCIRLRDDFEDTMPDITHYGIGLLAYSPPDNGKAALFFLHYFQRVGDGEDAITVFCKSFYSGNLEVLNERYNELWGKWKDNPDLLETDLEAGTK